MRRFTFILVILGILVVGIAPAMAQSSDTAHVRAANFSVDAGTVDVYADGNVLFSGLSFPDMGDWMEVPAGTMSIAVAPAGTSADQATVGPMNVTAAAGEWLTLAVVGEVAHSTLKVQVVVQDYSPIADGESRLNFFNAIPDSDPLNLAVNGKAVIQTVGFPGTMGPDSDGFTSVDVIAQRYALTITPYNDTSNTMIDAGSVLMGAGRQYFVAAVGLAADPTFVLTVTDIAGMTVEATPTEAADLGTGSAHVRIAHFSPGTGDVDIYVNGQLTMSGVTFPSLGDWAEMKAGVYSVAVTPAGGSLSDAIVGPEDVSVATDAWLTVAVIGEVQHQTAALQVVNEDFSPIPAGESRVSLFNAIPDSGPLDLLAGDTVLLETIGYPGSMGAGSDGYASVDIVAGNHHLTVTPFTDTSTTLLDAGTIDMGANRSYFVAAVGLVDDPLYVLVITDVGQMMGQ